MQLSFAKKSESTARLPGNCNERKSMKKINNLNYLSIYLFGLVTSSASIHMSLSKNFKGFSFIEPVYRNQINCTNQGEYIHTHKQTKHHTETNKTDKQQTPGKKKE